MKNFYSYSVFFLSPILIRIESYLSLYFILFYKTGKTMNGLEIFELIALPFFFLGIFIYFNNRFKNQKKKVLEYTDNAISFEELVDDMFNVVNDRKRQYLFDCLKSGKILKEPKYLTDFEKKLMDEKAEKLDKEVNNIKKILEYKFDNNESNRNNEQIPN